MWVPVAKVEAEDCPILESNPLPNLYYWDRKLTTYRKDRTDTRTEFWKWYTVNLILKSLRSLYYEPVDHLHDTVQ